MTKHDDSPETAAARELQSARRALARLRAEYGAHDCPAGSSWAPKFDRAMRRYATASRAYRAAVASAAAARAAAETAPDRYSMDTAGYSPEFRAALTGQPEPDDAASWDELATAVRGAMFGPAPETAPSPEPRPFLPGDSVTVRPEHHRAGQRGTVVRPMPGLSRPDWAGADAVAVALPSVSGGPLWYSPEELSHDNGAGR